MNDDQKKDECLVVANKDVENTEVKTEIIEEKVEGAVVAVVDMHVEAAQIHKEAAEVHIEAAEANIKKGNLKNEEAGAPDEYVEAAEVHKEAAGIHIEAAEDHIEEAKENKDYLTKKISLEEPDI